MPRSEVELRSPRFLPQLNHTTANPKSAKKSNDSKMDVLFSSSRLNNGDWSQVSMHSAWKAWQHRGRRRRRSWWWNLERQTVQSTSAEEERRVTEENVNYGSVSMIEAATATVDEEWTISCKMQRLEENMGVVEVDAEGAAEAATIKVAEEEAERERNNNGDGEDRDDDENAGTEAL
ncbi:uncharacterized protein HKW66_Vig0181350 [Vigna angularis]|uniref:Uncharacterized protein n=1 Tax=Phaseolus angularis TaxID=3914 RepID=A0A8T0K466_PHAAN|nr:uncharacterized protein HKW66_Vig0181350 [Vigna angularis]